MRNMIAIAPLVFGMGAVQNHAWAHHTKKKQNCRAIKQKPRYYSTKFCIDGIFKEEWRCSYSLVPSDTEGCPGDFLFKKKILVPGTCKRWGHKRQKYTRSVRYRCRY